MICGECGHYDTAHREILGVGALARLSDETGPCRYPIQAAGITHRCECPAFVKLEVRVA